MKALFEAKGLSFRSFAFREGVSHQAVCQSAAGHGSSHLREAIAREIDLTPWQLYPERYDGKGNHLGRIRDQQRSTRPHGRNVEEGKAGERVYIPLPDNLHDDHWLVCLVGMEPARAIAERLGGGDVLMPMGPSGNRARAWAMISNALAEGKSTRQAARAAGVHSRTVRRHRNGHSGARRIDPDQGDLF